MYADLGYEGFREMDGSTLNCPLLSLAMTPATTKLYTRILVAPAFYGYADCRCDDMRQQLQVWLLVVPWGAVCALQAITSLACPICCPWHNATPRLLCRRMLSY